jgi:hypothetical protein
MLKTTTTSGTRAKTSHLGATGHALVTQQQGHNSAVAGTYHHGITTASVPLGSTRLGQLNFTRDHTFYHGPGAVAPEVKSTVARMKDFTDPDRLGRKRAEWDQSVLPEKLDTFNQPVSTQKALFDIRTGMKDDTIVVPVGNRTYQGTDSRDAYYDGWNVSIKCPLPLH